MMGGGDDTMDLEMQLLPMASLPADEDDKYGYGSGGAASSSSSTRQKLQRAILVLHSMLIFTQGTSPTLSSSSNIDNDHGAITDIMEEAAVEFVDAAQNVPLLKIVDDTLHLRQPIRTLTHVLHSCRIFKAHAASAASACVHHGSSGATERKLQVAEAGDSVASSSGHHITIDETTTNEMTTANQLQRSQSKNISKIVREKNWVTLEQFGGLSGVADALGTDFSAGLSDMEAIYRSSGHQASSLSPTLTHKFSHLVWEEVKNKTILLLLLAVALSLVLGINEEGLLNGCYDGAIVLIAILLRVLISSIHKYWQQLRDQKKLEKQQFPQGVRQVHVIRGGEAKYICESKLVCGDVVLLKKGCQVPADGLFVSGQALELDSGSESCMINEQTPFLSYGERVINGNAQMVVTSINMDTGWSEMMSKATSDPNTKLKLETHLDKLNTCIHYTSLIISILLILVLLFRCMAGKMDDEKGDRLESMAEPTPTSALTNPFRKVLEESKYTTRALTKLLSISLVAVTEGVPFAVSLAIFYWSQVTLSGKATEQDPQVVAKMASVARIFTDTFGDFTEDETEVDKVFIGGEVISGCTTLSPKVVEALCDGICTLKEKAVVDWAQKKLGLKRKRTMQSLTKMCRNESVKEMILNECTHYFNTNGEKAPMDDEVRRSFDKYNEYMQHKQLRTIAFACTNRTDVETLDAEVVLVALLGLKFRSKEVTKEEVKACRECGIETVIVSSKKVSVLKDIALQCGVITVDDSESLAVITGEEFRKLTEQERIERVDKIRLMGEAIPSDKSLLMETLRKNGKVVAFLGQRTDEAPSLKGADIGIAMGTWSSVKARESCDIIIWDGSFCDVTSIISSGMHIYENIKRFLQLVLIMTISSTLINFSGTAALGDAPLTAVQLVWVNLAVDFLGGIALLSKSTTDKPLTSMVPVSCRRSLITRNMTTNILAQVSYQVILLMILRVKGLGALGTTSEEDMNSMVSNSFIMCQLFNLFNARELEKKNFFRGIHQDTKFWVSVATFMVLHAIFVMVHDILVCGTRLNWKLWGCCVVVGAISWPVDCLGKCISGFIKILVSRLL